MRVVVCVKQIPDPDVPQAIDRQTMRLDRSSALVLDPSDLYGVETALRLVEDGGGGEVVAVSMAPSGETAGVRAAMAMGVDRAVVVSDDVLAGSDALGTARALAAVIAPLEPDVVVTATESTDGYTGTMPVQLAELLGRPSVSFAKRVELEEGALRIERQTERGFDAVRCPLPAVITVTAGTVEPRYPTFKTAMAAKTKPVDVRDVKELELDTASVGETGARQRVLAVEPVAARRAGERVADDGSAFEQIVGLLEAWKII